MHPQAEFAAHFRHIAQRVERADGSRARAGDDGQDRPSRAAGRDDHVPQPVDIHAPPRIQRHLFNPLGADTKHPPRAGDAVMRVRLREDRGGRAVRQTPLPGGLECDVPSDEHGGQIGQRSTVGDDPAAIGATPTDVVAQLGDHRLLDGG